MGINLGLWLDTYTPEVAGFLRAMQPGAVLVGQGAWDHVPQIHADCGGNPLIILREIGLRIDVDHPIASAQRICGVAKRYPDYRCIAHGINEPVVGTHAERLALVAWELPFIEECHRLGVQTICLNLAWGNPGGEG